MRKRRRPLSIKAAYDPLFFMPSWGAASGVVPKFVSPADPAAQWTGVTRDWHSSYSDNYLMDVQFGVIVDVEASPFARPRSARRESSGQKSASVSSWSGLWPIPRWDDGRFEFDNSPVERSMHPITLTPKNALFAGSDGGAEHYARRRFADRNLQAPRRRDARLSRTWTAATWSFGRHTPGSAAYAQQLPFEQRRLFAAASAPPSGRLLRNDQRSGRLCPCARFPWHLCV